MPNGSGQRDTAVQSVDRAISVLQTIARLGEVGVTEIARELDVHKSTVSRLLSTLQARGMVEQDLDGRRYRLGYGVMALAASATRRMDLSVLSRPVCQALADAVGETVNVAIDDGGSAVSIDQVIGSSVVTTVNWLGRRTPLHATSAGKVFLAFMPADRQRGQLARRLERYTAETITDRKALRAELDEVRQHGYAESIDEHEPGLGAVAAPITDMTGEVVAALSVSGPTFRVNHDTVRDMLEPLQSAAAEISQRNGSPKRG